ncbi:RipA family octameric membrane protein [Yersinia proxima]|uniref:RipA family octameric membrane protein n=1 Tax=Yersinia proxima TaxID=2890316 RepID=UPI001D0F8304|nr:hypothetical protein [Yersinia proxima]
MKESDDNRAFGIRKFYARKARYDRNLLALEKAHEIRKFEIELYWKRTAYFWTLIAAMFAGFLLLASKHSEKAIDNADLYLIFIASTGFVFSYGWFLVNKGSKFWQENWEFHIDRLEDEITGPLYKTVLHRQNCMEKNKKWKELMHAPQNFSVSKINQFIAVYTMFLWAILMSIPSMSFWNYLFIMLFIFFILKLMNKHCQSEIKAEEEPMKIKTINRKTEF